MGTMDNKIIHTHNALGAGLLIAGSCIGIGMLALPVATGVAGFVPAVVVFVLAAIFMGSTALLLVEVDLSDEANVNIVSMAGHTLGTWAKALAWFFYLFLFYCLMVAYASKGGDILHLLFASWGFTALPTYLGSLILVSICAIAILVGRATVDIVNRLFMAGFLVAFISLLSVGFGEFDPQNLTHSDWTKTIPVVPFVITAFGFHNMIPTVSDYVKRSRRSLVKAVVIGGGTALIVYLLWNLVVQAAAPIAQVQEAYQKGWIGTELLYAISQNVIVRLAALYLSLFAIITSVLGQGLGLVDFLYDGFGVARNILSRIWIVALIFVPAFFGARLFANVFFTALELAGGVAAIFLFGLLPVMMAWARGVRVFGGKLTLIILGAAACVVLAYEAVHFLFA